MIILSIIVPNYNNGKFLMRCVNSILGSRHENFELVVIDDGSTDNSVEILQSVQDDRFRFFVQENKGVSVARNVGIKEASGKYITFCDADDYYLDGAVDEIIEKLSGENVESELMVFDVYIESVLPNGERDRKAYESPVSIWAKKNAGQQIDREIYLEYLYKNARMNSVCNKLYLTSLLRAKGICFPEGVRIGEDGLFNMQYAVHCNTIVYVPKNYYIVCRDESEVNTASRITGEEFIMEGLQTQKLRRHCLAEYIKNNSLDQKMVNRLRNYITETEIGMLYGSRRRIITESGRKKYKSFLISNPEIKRKMRGYLSKNARLKRKIQAIFLFVDGIFS